MAERLVTAILAWDSEKGQQNFYALAGDRSGSYFLEVAVECCAPALLTSIYERVLKESCLEYCLDPAANFVVQAMLKRLTADAAAWSSEWPGDSLLVVMNGIFGELSLPAVVEQLLRGARGGVVLWVLQLETAATELGKQFDRCVSESILSVWLGGLTDDDGALRAYLEAGLCAEKTSDGGNNQQLLGRLVGAIIQCGGGSKASALQRRCASRLVASVCGLPAESLLRLCCHGSLSRSVLDPMFDEADKASGEGPVAKSLGAMSRTLQEKLVEVATHFIGHHVLRRLFGCVGVQNQEQLAKSLAQHQDRLSAGKEGRATLKTVQAELLQRDEKGWRQWIVRQRRARDMFDEIVGTSAGTPLGGLGKKEAAGDDDVDGAEEGEEEGRQEKGGARKRKRKHGSKSKDAVTDSFSSDRKPEVIRPAVTKVQKTTASASPAVHQHSKVEATSTAASEKKKADFSLIAKLSKGKGGIAALGRELEALKAEKVSKK